MQKMGPCLWFDGRAEEAVNLYVSIFKNSRILITTYYLKGMHRLAGSVMMSSFILDGEEFVALNGGPEFTFSPAVSFAVKCDNQDEVDVLWRKLSEVGKEGQCGCLTIPNQGFERKENLAGDPR